jgi:hypothetical protein
LLTAGAESGRLRAAERQAGPFAPPEQLAA